MLQLKFASRSGQRVGGSARASRPCALSATACGWRHSAACRSRRPARTPLPPRAAGKKHEHDLHNLSNVDASQMQSDPGDLGRVADGVMEEQPVDKPRGRRSTAGSSKAKSASQGASGGAKRGRRKKGDPHELLNVDADPMESDPGDVGRTAPGVLEKYEHLDKLHPSHGQPATAASASESASGGGEGSTSTSGSGSGGGGAAEGQSGGAGAGPAAESDMLKTDSPGAEETQHPGETSPALMKQQEEQYFEGTGGVLLDVSHASPHPYHGEGVGRREDTHAGAHEGKAEGPAGGGGLASSAEGMESEGADVGDLE